MTKANAPDGAKGEGSIYREARRLPRRHHRWRDWQRSYTGEADTKADVPTKLDKVRASISSRPAGWLDRNARPVPRMVARRPGGARSGRATAT